MCSYVLRTARQIGAIVHRVHRLSVISKGRMFDVDGERISQMQLTYCLLQASRVRPGARWGAPAKTAEVVEVEDKS